MSRKLTLIVITFWVGGLWMTGFSASILFDTIKDRQLAGNVAGQLFTVVSYIGMVSSLFLLIQRFLENKMASFKESYFWIIIAMLILVLVGHFGIQAHLAQLKANAHPVNVMNSEYASQFSAWHGVSGAVFLIECLLGVALVLSRSD